MISTQLQERLTRLVDELYKQHIGRPSAITLPDGTVKLFTFQMSSVTNLCGTAGCAIGLDYQLEGVLNRRDYDMHGIDALMEVEGYNYSANALFYGYGDEYRCNNILTKVEPWQVADRIRHFLNDPDLFEARRKEQRAAVHASGIIV